MVPAVPLLQLPPLLPLLQVQDSVVAIWTPPVEKWTIFQSAVSICLDPHIVWKLLKMSHLDLSILVFFTDFCLETLFDRKLHFQKIAKLTFFGISNELLSTQNVNVARFARNVEWNFLCDFQTPWSFLHTYSLFHFFSRPSLSIQSQRTYRWERGKYHFKVFTWFSFTKSSFLF